MYETGCSGLVHWDDPEGCDGEGGGGGSGWGTHVHPWLIHVNIWQKPLQYCKIISLLQCRRPEFDPWVGKIPWRREQLCTPVFWPGELMDCIVHGVTESDTTERLHGSLCCSRFPKQGVELHFPAPEPVAAKNIKSVSFYVKWAWVHSTHQIQRLNTKYIHSMNNRLGKI